MLRFFSCSIFLLTLIGCSKAISLKTPDTSLNNSLLTSEDAFLDTEQYADYYLVIADASTNYFSLQKKMINIHCKFNIEIDTLRRYYNTEKKQILLPEDDEDEIYQGEYFPRRFEANTLSIEYAYIYEENNVLEPSNYPTKMILVAGMFVNKTRADSLQNVLKALYPKTFVQKSKIYIGCMH